MICVWLEVKPITCPTEIFADDTKMSGAVDTLEGSDAIQRHLDRLERWVHMNIMRFNKVKCRVQHMVWGNTTYQYRLGKKEIESSPAEKDLGVLLDEKLDVAWQCALAAQEANRALCCIPSRVDTGQGRGFCPSALLCWDPLGVLRPALEPSAQDRAGAVGAGPEEAPAMMRGLENLCWEERLGELRKRGLRGDFLVAFQYINGAYKKEEERRFTRTCRDMTRSNSFQLKKGRFRMDRRKKSFTMRIVRHWNMLSREVMDGSSLEVSATA